MYFIINSNSNLLFIKAIVRAIVIISLVLLSLNGGKCRALAGFIGTLLA